MIMRVRAIAVHTFKEAVRDRILVLFLVFALAMMAFSVVLSWLTVGDELKIVTDVGLAALSLFGTLIAVFIGITLVYKEVEKRTIYALLAKPVPRWQFLVGKYAGLMLTLAVVYVLMGLFYVALVWAKGGSVTLLVPAIFLGYVELSIVTAVALVFSSFTTPMLAAVFTSAVWIVGHVSWGFREFVERVPGEAARALAAVLYYGLPDLETFNVRNQLSQGIGVTPYYMLDALGYAIMYTAGMLVLAVLLFRRRDLT